MMIEEIKNTLRCNLGKTLKFRINGARNQTEKFEGQITCLYNSVFLVQDNSSGLVRSFSYSDVLTKNLIIYFK